MNKSKLYMVAVYGVSTCVIACIPSHAFAACGLRKPSDCVKKAAEVIVVATTPSVLVDVATGKKLGTTAKHVTNEACKGVKHIGAEATRGVGNVQEAGLAIGKYIEVPRADLPVGIRRSSDSRSRFAYQGAVLKPAELVTVLILPPFAAAFAACTPSPQEDVMRSASLTPGNAAQNASDRGSTGLGSGVPIPTRPDAGDDDRAAQGPIPEAVSAAENLAPDPPTQAQGRRTLSTAFVRVGPDGRLTVELRNGRVLVLRNVVMRPEDYCGVQELGGPAGVRYCGGYAEVAAARPGGAPAPPEPDLALSGPFESPRSSAKRN